MDLVLQERGESDEELQAGTYSHKHNTRVPTLTVDWIGGSIWWQIKRGFFFFLEKTPPLFTSIDTPTFNCSLGKKGVLDNLEDLPLDLVRVLWC
jgi:hypothetical protein